MDHTKLKGCHPGGDPVGLKGPDGMNTLSSYQAGKDDMITTIKAEIERLKAKYRKDMYKSNHEGLASGYKIEAYNELISFLSTLESEKPMNLDLEIEIENAGKDVIRQAHYHNKIFDIPQTHFEDVQLMDIFKAGVYKGCELGRNEK